MRITLILFLVVLCAFFSNVHGQRCADDINFFFNDKAGKNIDPARFDSLLIVTNDSPGRKPDYTEKNGSKGFWASTSCPHHIQQMRVEIVHRKKKMTLIFKRVPGDAGDIFLEGIPFSKGTFEFDFKFDLDKVCEDNIKGWHPNCTITPNRLKKVTRD